MEILGLLVTEKQRLFAWLATRINNQQTSVAAKLHNTEAIPNSANVITMNLMAL